MVSGGRFELWRHWIFQPWWRWGTVLGAGSLEEVGKEKGLRDSQVVLEGGVVRR